MHISEGFLPLSHCIAWGAASLIPTVVSVRAISKQVEKKREDRVLLAASAAFLFTLTALRMPSVTGSSSHPTGTAVGTYLFGPSAMPALALVTLVFQALLLAHGGLTTLGANLFSLGVVGPVAIVGLPVASAPAHGMEARPMCLFVHSRRRFGNLRYHRLPAGVSLSFRHGGSTFLRLLP